MRSVQASCSFFLTAAMPASRLAPSALLVRLTVSARASGLKAHRQLAIIRACSLVKGRASRKSNEAVSIMRER
ncbi:hypothetical protein D3C73_1373870 [compost metagenome]